MESNKPASPTLQRGRVGQGFHWMVAVLGTALSVVIPVCFALIADAHFANKELKAEASRSLDTLARITSEWVSGKIDLEKRKDCVCRLSTNATESGETRGSYCTVTRSSTTTTSSKSEPAKIWLDGGSLVIRTRIEECPAKPTLTEETKEPNKRKQAHETQAPTTLPSKPAECAANDTLCKECTDPNGRSVCKRESLEGLRTLLQNQLHATQILHHVVLETVDHANEHPQPMLRVGEELPAGEVAKAELAPNGVTLSPQPLNLFRRIELDGVETALVWRLHGVSLTDPWSAIGSNNLFLLVLLAALLVLTWPAFKVAFVSPVERITRLNVLHLLVAIPIAIAVGVVYLQTGLAFSELQLLEKQRLKDAALAAGQELTETVRTLAAETRGVAHLLQGDYVAKANPTGGRQQAVVGNLRSLPFLPEELQRLSRLQTTTLKTLPFDLEPNHITGLSEDGTQLVKIDLSTSDERRGDRRGSHPSPMSNYSDRPYFDEARKSEDKHAVFAQFLRSRGNERRVLLFSNRPQSGAGANQFGADEPVVWSVSFRISKPVSGDQSLFKKPGFALVDSDGNVLTHSMRDRMLSENFFASTSKEDELRLWVRQRPTLAKSFSFNYYGVDQLAVLSPIGWEPADDVIQLGEEGPDQWFVAAFEPTDTIEAIRSDLLLVGLAAAAYLLLVRVLLACFCVLAFGGKAEWWWPGSSADMIRRLQFGYATLLQCGILALVTWLINWKSLSLYEWLVLAALLLSLSHLGARLLLVPNNDKLWSRVRPSEEKLPQSTQKKLAPPTPHWATLVSPNVVYALFVCSAAAVPASLVNKVVTQLQELETNVAFPAVHTVLSPGTSAPPQDLSWAGQVLHALPFRDPATTAVRWCARATGGPGCENAVPGSDKKIHLSQPIGTPSVSELVKIAKASLTEIDGEWVFPHTVGKVLGWLFLLCISFALLGTLSRRVFGFGIDHSPTDVALQRSAPPREPLPRSRHIDLAWAVDAIRHGIDQIKNSKDREAKVIFHSCDLAMNSNSLRKLLLDAIEIVKAKGDGWTVLLTDNATRLDEAEMQRWSRVLSDCEFSEPTGVSPRQRYLWGLCTAEEQLLLIQLVCEGFVNPHRWAMAQSLCRRGLLDFGPNYRLRDASFEMFIRRAVPTQELQQWERTSGSSQWPRVSTAITILFMCILGVLALGFPDLLHGNLGVLLTTVLGWFALLGPSNLAGSVSKLPEIVSSIAGRR